MVEDPAVLSIPALEPVLDGERPLLRERRGQGPGQIRLVVGVDAGRPALAQLVVQPAAGEVEPALVHVRPAAVGPREPHHQRGAVRHPAEALLALAHRPLGLLPRERAGEHVGQQPQPRDQLVGPVTLRAEGADREGARDRAAHHEGHQDGRAGAEALRVSPIDRRLVGKIPEAREPDDVPLAQPGHDPRRPLPRSSGGAAPRPHASRSA